MVVYNLIAIIDLANGKNTSVKKFSMETILPGLVIGLILVSLKFAVMQMSNIIDEELSFFRLLEYGVLIALAILMLLIFKKKTPSISSVILILVLFPIIFIFTFSIINNLFYTKTYQKSYVILEKKIIGNDDDKEEANLYEVSVRDERRIISVPVSKEIWLKKQKKDSIKVVIGKGFFGYEFVLKILE